MAVINGAKALTTSLVHEGVDTIFALPGVQIMSIFDALYDEPRIRVVVVRNEQATTYMADGYARTTGKPGVALVVPGPGLLNALAGLGTAYAASSPVLLISGQIPSREVGSRKGLLHEIDDQLEAVRPLTKWNKRVMKPREIPFAVREAMHQLRTGRPRPVELEIPPDVLKTSEEIDFPLPTRINTMKRHPYSSLLKLATRLLQQAKKPLILVGSGVISSGATQALFQLAEAIPAPVLATPEAKGSISDNHWLSLGSLFFHFGAGYYALPKADVVLAVGTRLFIQGGMSFHPSCKIVQLDIDKEELGRNYKLAIGIQIDARAGLLSILSMLEHKRKCASSWTRKELDSYRKKAKVELKKHAPLQTRIIDSIRSALDEDAIVVSGITNVAYWSSPYFQTLKSRTFITSSYFGTLGFAFPTAIGAKIGNPEKKVVALCGDGGFMFAIQELATAVHERVDVVVLLFNNQAYGASLSDQLLNYDKKIIGTKLKNPDFIQLTKAFGARAVRLSSSNQLEAALKVAFKKQEKNKGPIVIEVPIPVLPAPFT